MEAKAMRLGWGMLVGVVCFLGSGVAQAAPCGPPADETWTALTASTVTLKYRFLPDALTVGQALGIEVVACPQSGATAPDKIRVDARMPAHGHGMNYRPTTTRLAAGHYRFDGLLLHMPGQWQIVFDVMQAGQRTRLAAELELDR